MNPFLRALYQRRVRETVEGTAAAYGATAEITWIESAPATYNDGKMAQLCEKIAQSQGMKTVPEEQSLGGDDFSYYMEEERMGRQVPGCYLKIGTGVAHPIHHPAFCVDENVILPAAKYLAKVLAEDLDNMLNE